MRIKPHLQMPPEVGPRGPEFVALGRALREARARRGLSQEELGFRSGVHRNYVGAIERGEINPTFRLLLKLGNGLKLPLSELVMLHEAQYAELYGDTGSTIPG